MNSDSPEQSFGKRQALWVALVVLIGLVAAFFYSRHLAIGIH